MDLLQRLDNHFWKTKDFEEVLLSNCRLGRSWKKFSGYFPKKHLENRMKSIPYAFLAMLETTFLESKLKIESLTPNYSTENAFSIKLYRKGTR